MSKSNRRYVTTVAEALQYLERFPDDGVLVDVDVKKGMGYFPTIKAVGRGTVGAWEVDYNHLTRNTNFDIENTNVLMVDITQSEAFKREFIMDRGREVGQPNLPDYAMRLGELKSFLSSHEADTVILKPIGGNYNKQKGDFCISANLSNYNNDSYKFVDGAGNIVTDGLTSDQTACFSFIGKSGGLIEGMHFTFIPEGAKEASEMDDTMDKMIQEQKAIFNRFIK